jgi:hypothetical protein
MSKINKYRKYKYIIWSDEDGFHSLESLSEDDLKSMSAALKTEISIRKRHTGNESKKESDSK